MSRRVPPTEGQKLFQTLLTVKVTNVIIALGADQ